MTENRKSILYTFMTILFWSTSATAFKIALEHTSPYNLLFYSSLFSTIIILLILLVQRKAHLIRVLKLRDFRTFALLGLLNPFGFYVLVFQAYNLLPGQIALTLNFSWPIALTLLSVPILKQTLKLRQVVAILISFSGVVLISGKGQLFTLEGVNSTGVFLALLSTVIWAMFWLFNVKHGKDAVLKLFFGFGFGTLYSAIFSPLWGGLDYLPLTALLPVIYISVFEMGVTFVVWLLALKYAPNTARISNFIFITPFLSLLFLRLVLNEELYFSTLLGLVLIVLGILYQRK